MWCATKFFYASRKSASSVNADTDENIKNYVDKKNKVLELVKDQPGLVKARLINIFNHSYIKQKDILLNRSTGFLCLKEENEPLLSNAYFEDVVRFCLNTDICAKLNMSVVDFMRTDLFTFQEIKRLYEEYKPKVTKSLDELTRDLENLKTRQQK